MESETVTDLRSIPFTTADGGEATLADYADKVVLIVNVASKCGLAPQYEQLESMQKEYGPKGFTVLGFPSNQFLQEPGSTEQILEYCSTTWGVTFPIADKVKVNGRNAAPLYKALKQAEDESGNGGRVTWNFEKFLVTPDNTVRRFRPKMLPNDASIISVIEENLPA